MHSWYSLSKDIILCQANIQQWDDTGERELDLEPKVLRSSSIPWLMESTTLSELQFSFHQN